MNIWAALTRLSESFSNKKDVNFGWNRLGDMGKIEGGNGTIYNH